MGVPHSSGFFGNLGARRDDRSFIGFSPVAVGSRRLVKAVVESRHRLRIYTPGN